MRHKKAKNLLEIVFLSLILVLIIFSSFNSILALIYQNKLYPGTKIAGIKVGAKTKNEALEILTEKNKDYLNDAKLGLTFENKKQEITPQEISTLFETQKTIESVFDETHQNFILSPSKSLFFKKSMEAENND